MAFEGVWLIQPGNPEPHKVPDQPGVIAYFKGRGWQVTDLPADLDADDPEFIEALEKLQADDEIPSDADLPEVELVPLEAEDTEPVEAKSAVSKKEKK